MTEAEVITIIREIRELWPEWELNDAQLAAWRMRLERMRVDWVRTVVARAFYNDQRVMTLATFSKRYDLVAQAEGIDEKRREMICFIVHSKVGEHPK